MASKIICYNVATKIGPRTSPRCFKTRQYVPGCPKGRLNCPKTPPRDPKTRPRRLPRRPQDALRSTQDAARHTQDVPRHDKDASISSKSRPNLPRPRIWVILATMLADFPRILKGLGNEFGSMFGLISKLVLAELRFIDRPRRVREAKRIQSYVENHWVAPGEPYSFYNWRRCRV